MSAAASLLDLEPHSAAVVDLRDQLAVDGEMTGNHEFGRGFKSD
jgi:hypothetical protein